MKLRCDFDEAYVEVESGSPFLPYVGGEPARLELCALAAKLALGVALTAALDPWEAARAADIPVLSGDYLASFASDIREQLLVAGSRGWSAMTMLLQGQPVILMNPTHDRRRQKVTLAEELAHLVMGHPPSRLDGATGIRTYDSEVEDEAYGVGGAMVLPYAHLFPLAKQGTPPRLMATRFAVSEQFVNYRINRAGLRPMYRKRTAAASRSGPARS